MARRDAECARDGLPDVCVWINHHVGWTIVLTLVVVVLLHEIFRRSRR
jgi:hypothetical protein